jgi:hypothetical protein
MKFWHLIIFAKICQEFPSLIKSDKNNGYFTRRLLHVYDIISPTSTVCPTRYRTRLAGGPLLRVAKIRRTTDTFLFISHTTNVPLFKCRCNIFIGVGIIKEMPVSLASGTHCSYLPLLPEQNNASNVLCLHVTMSTSAYFHRDHEKTRLQIAYSMTCTCFTKAFFTCRVSYGFTV